MQKAREDLASAEENYAACRFVNAVRDAHFACFHSFSSVLMKNGKIFKKHKEVRSELHRHYIRNGLVEAMWGKHYDWLFDNRQKADYRPLVSFESDQVREILKMSTLFVGEMEKLLQLPDGK
jgi:uncharacterized protein (UPF0332 family)